MVRRLVYVLIFFLASLMLYACLSTSSGHIDWDIFNQTDKVLSVVEVESVECFWTGLASALAGGAVSVGSQIANWFSAKETQEKTWEREDSAVQRRVADLKAAGLSPTLAAGSAASSGVTSAPQVNGNGVSDALSAAMQLQQIKNAKQENANMQVSRLNDLANISFLSRQGAKEDAQANYFNAMANKALIDGEMATVLGLRQAEEIAEKTKGYKYSAMSNFNHSILAAQQSINEALETDLIRSTGMRSTNSSFVGNLAKMFSRGMFSLAEVFGNREAGNYRVSDSLKNFMW